MRIELSDLIHIALTLETDFLSCRIERMDPEESSKVYRCDSRGHQAFLGSLISCSPWSFQRLSRGSSTSSPKSKQNWISRNVPLSAVAASITKLRLRWSSLRRPSSSATVHAAFSVSPSPSSASFADFVRLEPRPSTLMEYLPRPRWRTPQQ